MDEKNEMKLGIYFTTVWEGEVCRGGNTIQQDWAGADNC